MKNLKTILLVASMLVMTGRLFSQAPSGIPYQAVARDANGNLFTNQNISVRFSIHDLAATGTVVYKESHASATNNFGLFNLNIGQGTPITGTMSGVPWGTGSKFLQVEFDPAGGSSFTDMGTTQMMSMPYALHAGQSVAFMAKQSGNIPAPPGVYLNMPYNNEVYDDANGAAANNFNNSTGVFTVPISGIYHFDVSIAWLGSVQVNPIRYLELVVNGSNSAGGAVIRPVQQGWNVNINTSIDLKLNAGDLVQVRAAHNNAGGSETVWGLGQYSFFSGHKVN